MSTQNKKYCHACGYTLEATAAFCPGCGRAQANAKQPFDSSGLNENEQGLNENEQNPYSFGAPASPHFEMPSSDECNMAMLAHLLQMFTGFIGPLIIWILKKEESKFVDDQAKEALNFQITLVIATTGLIVLTIATCGMTAPLLGVVPVLAIVFGIIATLKAKEGFAYRYPMTIRLLK